MKRILLICSAALWAVAARSDTIVYSDFGTGGILYSQNLSDGGPASSPLEEIAAQFTAGASGDLAAVDLGLTYVTQGPANVYLYGDSSGLPDNAHQTLLGSVTPTAAFGTVNNSVVSLAVAGTVPVTIGNKYWLVLKPGAANVDDAWNLGADAGFVAASSDDSIWSTGSGGVVFLPAFRLTATGGSGGTGGAAVPDSGGTFLLMVGSIAVLLARAAVAENDVTMRLRV